LASKLEDEDIGTLPESDCTTVTVVVSSALLPVPLAAIYEELNTALGVIVV
jgi:hypothetical protein